MSIPGGASQSFYLYNIISKYPQILRDKSQCTVSLLSERIQNKTRPVYVWDMHALANVYVQNPNSNGFTAIDPTDTNWNPIWLKDYSDNSGNSVYDNLSTAFTVAPFNHPVGDKFATTGSINLTPLVSLGTSETINSNTDFYKLAIFPGIPFFIGSSVPTFQHFGPLFADHISFSVSGSGSLGAVNTTLSFSGGKCITTTPLPQITPITDDNGNSYPYRPTTFVDCLIGFDVWTSAQEMQSDLENIFNIAGEAPDSVNPLDNSNDPEFRIIEMKLNVQQTVKYTVTQPDTAANGFTIEQGPRWASIQKRVVTGEVTFYSRTDVISQPTSGSLTMYFGDPFFFPMDNVDWQRPEQKVSAGSGWIQTFNFIARAANNAVVGYPGNNTNPVSEFAIAPTSTGDVGTATGVYGGNGLNFYG